MIRQNSKGSLKIFNAKIVSPITNVKTPISQSTPLTQRAMNIISPGTNRKQASTQRKIVSIDLKPKKKQQNAQNIGISPSPGTNSTTKKKILKLRRKTQSVEKPYSNSQPRTVAQFCQQRITKAQSSTTLNPKLKCFDEINFINTNQHSANRLKQNNWDQIVETKKQILYEQIYKMDKKIFSLERDLQNVTELPDKRAIIEMVRKKTGEKNVGFGAVKPIQIHSNIYKMAKNRIS